VARQDAVAVDPVRWWLLALIVALGLALVPVPAWVVDEFYSRDMYPWVQTWMTTATNLLPLAVLDALIVGAVALVVVRIGRLWRVARDRGVLDAGWELIRRVIRFAAVLTILFLATWGCNYRRLPLETALTGQRAITPTVESLRHAVADANALAARLRPLVVNRTLGYDELADQLREPMNDALRQLSRPALRTAGRPKFSLILTPFFTLAGVNGMLNPFALESIVHPDLLPFERPFVLAHEWGHLAGQADEAEASAVGWLACLKGPPAAAYSASLYLIMEAVAALPRAARRTAVSALDAAVRSDLSAIAERVQRQHPVVQDAAQRAYHEYLKANRVEDGTASYGRALTLILASPVYDAMGVYSPYGFSRR
jgi:hypothetical protein